MSTVYMEPNVARERSSNGDAHRLGDTMLDERVERAASEAVADVAMNVRDWGATDEEAQAVQEAMRFGLLRQFDKAERTLIDSGFEGNILNMLMTEIRRSAA
ncbi:hypothetical protein QO001_005640 [Methylobacterium brachiatum]|uniref:Uncharacterized protein n=1 Tax=Methylobacterium brachiatum TaxID=269660 RepID=A0AAJ1X0R6_9HYPH|nr:hypothetical protein [Methylobacterium brachiatum]MCB4806418.1 hypothetical protein [Methylobacterium brachiatum]MDQ0546688.1 hypothetical protein [Methylobacterium brachiatum]